jgi:hypothetical protein
MFAQKVLGMPLLVAIHHRVGTVGRELEGTGWKIKNERNITLLLISSLFMQ